MNAELELTFQGGTLRLSGLGPARGDDETPDERLSALPSSAVWDTREQVFRMPAIDYAELILGLRASKTKIPLRDQARAYATLALECKVQNALFPYQKEALDTWIKYRSRGVVVLPTGAGKTYLATVAILSKQRSTLVVVPTLDLVNQWYDVLCAAFGVPVGIVGGGYHEVLDLCVTTYDSAHLHMDRMGNRFGLIIFDECHHLPSASYALAARMSLAPFRLGLTATPERSDGRAYSDLIGPIVYRKDISELSGEYLASYEVIRLDVPLSSEEREAYENERSIYIDFLRANGIRMATPEGFGRFILLASQSDTGRRALAAYRRHRALALAAPGKLSLLARLLHTHRNDRTLVFTEDNATVYQISRRFLLPAITHQSKVKERSFVLSAFNEGKYTAVVTSKVLNEGVNVPKANVAIVLSGSGSVREHVQRLGRILRKAEGKNAILYELVAAGTTEERVSERRRDHSAYQ